MGKKYRGRVSELIHRKVTQLLLEESNDPRFGAITVTDVDVNQDTTRAEIYYSLIGTPEERKEVQTALDKASGWLRAQLAPTLRLRNLPELVFLYDASIEHGAHIEAILSQLQKEEPQEHGDVGETDPGSGLTGAE